ncbi:alpha/beta hydrolase [Georgenia subflava]|uniref:Alpha/beta fold hydrolase n=1 Tax=Georgenia subflava TaxID=1622177 RepID=A0A6N7ED92_9MICO|nr:alpha/beta hydrolase [Georgenia subflava]MPV36069.1 alpha/beta fold hydrolase [Georgenia subflava]
MERERRPRGAEAGSGARAGELPHLDGVEHRFVDLPGLRMHVAQSGSGEPLLLLHGFPQHWWAWRKVIPGLAAHYRVICPDLRGAGWTDAPDHGYERDQLMADVVGLIDELGLDTVRLVGHDVGGILGFRLCLAHPERIRQYVAVAAPHPYPNLSPRMLLYMWRLWPTFALATPKLGPRLLGSGRQRFPRHLMTAETPDPDVWSEQDLDLYASRLRDPARARAAAALYRGLAVGENRRAAAGEYRGTRLRTPTLGLYGVVLYGGDVEGGNPGVIGGYEGYSDDFTMTRIPGAGYYIPEEKPEAFLAHTLEFFDAA